VTKRESDFAFIKKIFGMKKTPYWNFWRVVFAGWMIRYPGKFMRPFAFVGGFLIVLIYNALTN
jgi:hypothetical protein